MMTAIGEVIAQEDDWILVRCERQSSCQSCAAKQSCGTGVVANVLPKRATEFRVVCLHPVSIGSRVEIGIAQESFLRLSLLIYMLPMLFLILGSALGQWFASLFGMGEGITIFLGVISAVLGFFIARFVTQKWERKANLQPVLVKIFP